MNLDPETLFSLLDRRPASAMPLSGPSSAATTHDGDPGPAQPESIVGGPFLWASGSTLINLS
jgi:hypothetical protein